MSVVASWYANKRVLYLRIEGKLTSEDVEAFRQTAKVWQSKQITPNHVIVDEREAHGMLSQSDVLYEILDAHCNISGWKLIVCHAASLPQWANTLMLRRWKGMRTRKFITMGTALAFLQGQDPVLPRLMLQQEIA